MGNSHTKEARAEHAGSSHRFPQQPAPNDAAPNGRQTEQSDRHRNRQSRFGRTDLSLLGIGAGASSGSREDAPYERKETRQEREARRLERERVAREKERERSLKEEHIDGGYLVTLGTYTGPEDFSKQIVRQLQIERKLAPFWRGLNDKDDSWTEYQLVCAGRGLPIPAADEQPPEEFIVKAQSPNASSQNINNLTVPMDSRTLSTGSNGSGSATNLSSAVASPTTANPQRSSSPFKPRAKALAAALSVGSRNNSSTDMTPREVNLPHDPFVNGQPLEVALYKDATECPICFLYYPPYLNRTRCCDQPICSECFVQIKRADPHFPEHHPEDPEAATPEEARDPEMLISEPATCPYCQQTEFGVSYDPPVFRRGLSYATPTLSSMNTAMSSQSSLNSNLSPGSPHGGRRRAQSLSANAPNVITTDRVRPDWSTKLATQRAHQARRAAAATALHTAAFLIGDQNQSRSFSFGRPGRFSRRNTGQGSASDNQGGESPGGTQEGNSATGPEPGPRGSSGGRGLLGRRNRMDELEDMMLMEAVRLSLAAEEERQRKQEKIARKEAKKREKEERKAAKKAEKQGNPYSGQSSASGSTLSLGLGRLRGNSQASNLRVEATVQGAQATSPTKDGNEGISGAPACNASAVDGANNSKGKGVDRSRAEDDAQGSSTQSGSTAPSLPIPTASRGPSHLRQISNASSVSSSLGDSPAGSYSNQGHLDPNNPPSYGTSPGANSDDGGDASEPMFNFRSLAEMVGVDIENGEAADCGHSTSKSKGADGDEGPETEQVEDADPSVSPTQTATATLQPPTIPEVPEEHGDSSKDGESPRIEVPMPELMITPETPAPLNEDEGESKQLGAHNVVERPPAMTH